MAVEFVQVESVTGIKKVAVDHVTVGSDEIEVQVFKLLTGGDGVAPEFFAGSTRWSALSGVTTLVNGDATAPTLKNLANLTNKLSNEFDNSLATNRVQYADFELLCRGATAMTADSMVHLWIIACLDGTNYEDGGDSVTPARPSDDHFFVRPVATAQRLVLRQLLVPPTKFKVLIRNETGVAFTNVDAENVLRMRNYAEVSL